MISRRDLPPLALLAALVVGHFAADFLAGRTLFMGEMTYFYHPWQALSTELLSRGVFPHWNPYAFLGTPLHANMQSGLFAPGTLPFRLFGFETGLKLQLLLTHLLAGAAGYLWCRRWGRAAGFAGGAAWSLGGFLLMRVGFSWTQTLCWWPMFFLLRSRPLALGLAMAVSMLGGYPPMWAGMAGALLVLPWGARLRDWATAVALGFALCSVMLVPGAEFVRRSDRSAGTRYEDRVMVALEPAGLAGFASPALISGRDPSGTRFPLNDTYHVGLAACLLAGAGLLRLRRAALGWTLAYVAGAIVLLLGASNPVSAWAWRDLPPLRFLRHPAHLVYLPLAALIPLAALALKGRRWAPWAALLVAGELLFWGHALQPTMPSGYFTEAGPLARTLQASLGGRRYLPSPQAAHQLGGQGRDMPERYLDIKRRLYAVSNAPFHVASAGAIAESVLIGESYRVMDFMFSRRNPADALRYMPWLDASILVLPAGKQELVWNLVRSTAPARARWVPEGQPLEDGIERAVDVKGSLPAAYAQLREDRARVVGSAPRPGWAFIADPPYPGWNAWLNGEPVRPLRALTAFQRVAVAEGPFRLDLRFRSGAFCLGAFLSMTTLLALIAGTLKRYLLPFHA